MATSKNFFGKRSGSTANHTYAVVGGKQVTKDRPTHHTIQEGTRLQAARFAEAARFYPFVKKYISRSDFFRLAQGVTVDFVSANSIPVARWPMSWGHGQLLDITKESDIALMTGLKSGVYPDGIEAGYDSGWWRNVSEVTRERISWFFKQNKIQDYAVLIFSLFYKKEDDNNVYQNTSFLPLIFNGKNGDAQLRYPQFIKLAEEDYFGLDLFGDGRIVFLYMNDTDPIAQTIEFGDYLKDVVAFGFSVYADGVLSKSYYFT